MIRFFRNYRQFSIREGKIVNYLTYAIGEIILVVIGILIALQFNTFHENHINKKVEHYYLSQMKIDLVSDSLILNQELANFEKKLPVIQGFLTEIQKENNKESFNEAFRNYIDNILVPLSFVSNRSTYSEMESSGQLGIIRDKELRNRIVTLYNNLEKTENAYQVNYEFMQPIDAILINDKGIAKFQKYQRALFSPYTSEDDLYALKSMKAELESNAANWNWTIVDMQPGVTSQLDELGDVIARINAYLEKD
jgi:hypothetical protein